MTENDALMRLSIFIRPLGPVLPKLIFSTPMQMNSYENEPVNVCFTAAIHAVLLSLNPPKAKIQQINAAAMTNRMTVPVFVLD